MKKYLILIIMTCPALVYSTDTLKVNTDDFCINQKNAITIEKTSILILDYKSIIYERHLFDNNFIALGVDYLEYYDDLFGESDSKKTYFLPHITINSLFGKKNHYFELNFGTIGFRTGYRYQNCKNGIIFKTFLGLPQGIGISLGMAF